MQLAGELAKISLPSVIQLLHNGQLTGKVCLTQGANTAFIYVRDGRLVHAETDSDQGRAALLELFLWLNGTFSFLEANVDAVPQSLVDEPLERIVRDGMAYLEKKKQLDQLRISSRTVLKAATDRFIDNALFQQLDGKTTLGAICASLQMRRYDYINSVHDILTRGLASVVDVAPGNDSIKLPDWVVSRLKQDNPDVTQAIVEMVIWVDRVKCWMYQADADLERIVGQLDEQKALVEGETATESVGPETKSLRTGLSAILADESA